ncbi:Transcription initiation factor TFIID subunit 12 like protein [Verticillium longisporum]|nr:Transcription initiation factor TFIID subunit 12 like protein [Verticillium longisporum]
MNTQGQPAPQGQPQPNAQQGAAGHPAAANNQRSTMYRPEMMRNLPVLNDEEKLKYERGLRSLWNTMESHGEETSDHQDAKKKIQDFTKMLMGKLQARRLQQMQQAQKQQAQQQGQAGQQTQRSTQPAASASPAPPAPAETPATQNTAAVAPDAPDAPKANPAASLPTNASPAPAANAAASAPPQAPPQQAQQPQQQVQQQQPQQQAPQQQQQQPQQQQQQQSQPPNVPEHILNHIRSMTFNPPPQIVEKGPEMAAKWSADIKQRYVRSLMQMEHMGNTLRKLNAAVKDRQDKGNPLGPEEQKQIQIRKDHSQKVFQEAQMFVQNFRKTQEIGKANPNAQNAAAAARPAQQNNPNAPGAANVAQAVPQASAPQPVSGIQQNAQPAAASAAVEAAKMQQMNATGRASPVANGVTTQQQQSQLPQQPQGQQALAANSQPAPQAQPATTAPPPQQNQHIQPPPVNTAVASVAGTAGQPQSASTPTQAAARIQTPQTGAAGVSTQALSHSAAVSRANQRVNSQPVAVTPVQPSAGTPSSAGPISQGVMGSGAIGNSQQGHPQPHPGQPTQQTQTLQSKLPIPKQLPEKATQVPQPVNMVNNAGAGRPTYTGGTGIAGGVMGHPALGKIPAFSHEAEGDRVLSKKKLDELVRQVCGGTAEGQEGNLLSPEVEENVLTLADSFVDNVLHAACRNAKERGSKVLEIRDIQLVLERKYNIRVPGYSSDDLRTVRKVQPAPAWITKMSAIQAAKVTSGKGE